MLLIAFPKWHTTKYFYRGRECHISNASHRNAHCQNNALHFLLLFVHSDSYTNDILLFSVGSYILSPLFEKRARNSPINSIKKVWEINAYVTRKSCKEHDQFQFLSQQIRISISWDMRVYFCLRYAFLIPNTESGKCSRCYYLVVLLHTYVQSNTHTASFNALCMGINMIKT